MSATKTTGGATDEAKRIAARRIARTFVVVVELEEAGGHGPSSGVGRRLADERLVERRRLHP